MEHAHLGPMLFVDIDELLLCPWAASSRRAQQASHAHIFRQALSHSELQGPVGELNFIRKLYGGRRTAASTSTSTSTSASTISTRTSSGTADATVQGVVRCLHKGFSVKSVSAMLDCYAPEFFTVPLPKSADLTEACPFHYDHFSCMAG